MQNQSTHNARTNAQTLRKGMTDSERRLWSRLRQEQLGAKFRRQHPVGPYVADFACLDPKLIVELDGSQHGDQQAYDARRDEFLRAQGFDVIRFATNDPLTNLDGVVQVIAERVGAFAEGGAFADAARAPIPTFPQRGKELMQLAPQGSEPLISGV